MIIKITRHKTRRIVIPVLMSIIASVFIISCSSPSQQTISWQYRQYLKDSLTITDIPENKDSVALELFLQGAKYEQQGLYADAIIDYMDAYRYDSSAVILYAIGKNYLRIYKYELAEQYLLEAIASDSTLVRALETLSECYIRTFKNTEAIDAIQELYKVTGNKKYLYSLAYLHEYSDQKKALEIYEQILETMNDPQILPKLAQLYLETGDTLKYVAFLEKAYQSNKDNTQGIIDLFGSYLNTKKYENAKYLIDTTDIRLLTDDLSEIYQTMGYNLVSIIDSASNNLKRSYLSKIDSRFYFNWQLASLCGQLNLSIGDTVKGEELLLKSIGLADTIPENILYLSNHYIDSKKYDKALQLIEEYEDLFADDNRFIYSRGYAYTAMNKFEEARDIYLDILENEPDNSSILTQLGIIYDRLEQVDSSDYYYQQSLIINPDDPLANNNYAYSLSLRKVNLDKALMLSTRALELDSANSSYLDTYGWIMYQKGNYKEALPYIKLASELDDSTAEVFEHLGDVYFKLGDNQNAISAWEKGIKLEPGNKILIEKIRTVKP
jgi:tetratricopeptide (TPR) repeat protein